MGRGGDYLVRSQEKSAPCQIIGRVEAFAGLEFERNATPGGRAEPQHRHRRADASKFRGTGCTSMTGVDLARSLLRHESVRTFQPHPPRTE